MKKLKTITIFLLSAIFAISGCSADHHMSEEKEPAMSVNVNPDGSTVYNGSEQLFYEVREGQKAVVHFKIDTKQGSIAFDIQEKENENAHQYRGTVTESCEFDIVIEEPNQYRIYITANDFHGTYLVDWKTE